MNSLTSKQCLNVWRRATVIGNKHVNYQSIFRASTTTTNNIQYEISNSLAKPSIPALGFGTWGVDHFSHDIMAKSVDVALKIGYRHLDCARVYGNEKEIGHIIADNLKNGTVKRNELFITSKLFNQEWDNASNALESTLKDLQLDYVDSFLIHWPFRNTPNMTTPRLPYELEPLFNTYKKLYEFEVQGLTRSIGMCNSSMKKMAELIDLCDNENISRPGILQNEIHPYFQQNELLKFCEKENVILTGFMPLGSPERPARSRRDNDPVVMNDPELHSISKEVGYSVAQVIIRWHLQRGTVCIPKATEEWMIKQNLHTLDFTLNDKHMNRINALDNNFRYHRGEFLAWDDNMDWEELWDYE